MSPRFMIAVFLFFPLTAIFAQSNGLPGNVNGDTRVDHLDYRAVGDVFGGSAGLYDLNGNGRVDVYDLSIVLKQYGKVVPQPTGVSAPEHRIGVRDGKFYDRQTGSTFVPRGVTYVRLGPHYNPSGTCSDFHSLFDVQLPDPCVQKVYDPQDAEAQLGYMEWSGYNVVRVFINHEHAAGGGTSIDTAYIANVKDFIARAKNHNFQVWLVLGLMPSGYFSPWQGITNIGWSNAIYLSQLRINDKKRYLTDFITALKAAQTPMDAIFAYDIDSEVALLENEKPMDMATGSVTTANGQTYNLAEPGIKERIMDDGFVYFTDQLVGAVKSVDPTALATVSFYSPIAVNQPGDNRITSVRKVLMNPGSPDNGSSVDFVDFHVYPEQGPSLQALMDGFAVPENTRKPVVMGEFGAIKPADWDNNGTVDYNPYPTVNDAALAMRDWQVASCQYGFDGWIFWTWDLNPDAFYNATQDNGVINGVLSPKSRSDACQ